MMYDSESEDDWSASEGESVEDSEYEYYSESTCDEVESSSDECEELQLGLPTRDDEENKWTTQTERRMFLANLITAGILFTLVCFAFSAFFAVQERRRLSPTMQDGDFTESIKALPFAMDEYAQILYRWFATRPTMQYCRHHWNNDCWFSEYGLAWFLYGFLGCAALFGAWTFAYYLIQGLTCCMGMREDPQSSCGFNCCRLLCCCVPVPAVKSRSEE